jgi:hypothetical protein
VRFFLYPIPKTKPIPKKTKSKQTQTQTDTQAQKRTQKRFQYSKVVFIQMGVNGCRKRADFGLGVGF